MFVSVVTGAVWDNGKETFVNYSAGKLIEMTKVLSEGEFEQLFQQHFQGELGQLPSYLKTVHQTLQLLSVSAQGATELIPKSAEFDREAENSFNSVWELIEHIQSIRSGRRACFTRRGSVG